METFTSPKPFKPHPEFATERAMALQRLEELIRLAEPDPPLITLLLQFMQIPFCFTLQSCYGQFVYNQSPGDRNLAPVSSFPDGVQYLRYRLAYMVFCIEDKVQGHALYGDLESMTDIDPLYIQFGSADWFWDMTPNTYVIQLEPLEGASQDSVVMKRDEATHLERLRYHFFVRLGEIAQRNMSG